MELYGIVPYTDSKAIKSDCVELYGIVPYTYSKANISDCAELYDIVANMDNIDADPLPQQYG